MKGCWWCAVILAVLSISGEALAQSVVDSENCEEYGIECPQDGQPSYKKYCCVENDDGTALYSCCNPYIGLIIGISIGIPLVILIIVGVVVLYCVCHHRHNRRMQVLMATYRRRRREENRRREVRDLAPPPYSILSEEGEELPAYTETDPYKNITNGLHTIPEERGNDGEEVAPSHLETDELEGRSLSNEQCTSDSVPLLNEEGEG